MVRSFACCVGCFFVDWSGWLFALLLMGMVVSWVWCVTWLTACVCQAVSELFGQSVEW